MVPGSVMRASPVGAAYDKPLDRESAFEVLKKRTEQEMSAKEDADNTREEESRGGSIFDELFGSSSRKGRRGRQTAGEAFVKSMARSAGTQIGRRVMRGILGSIFK